VNRVKLAHATPHETLRRVVAFMLIVAALFIFGNVVWRLAR
jgi:hypothetical protein